MIFLREEMTSKEDDTLPLPALSLELSADVTADEDFIPTSQPLGSKCSKTSSNKSAEEAGTAPDDTLPREVLAYSTISDKDKSTDFIPDTETKKIHIVHAKDDPLCKKKLPVFDDAVQPKSDPPWESRMPQVPESPALGTEHFSLVNGSPSETAARGEKSIAEIIVNDSAETVDLEGSPMKVKSERGAKSGEELSVSCSINSDPGRCEETQIFDNSSVLLLEQPGPLCAEQSGKSIKEPTPSQNVYLMKTVEDNESDLQEQEKVIVCCSPGAVASAPRTPKEDLGDGVQSKENAIPVGVANAAGEDESSLTIRKIDFNLTVTCFVSFNVKTNKVLHKFISKVTSNPLGQKPQKPAHVDHFSDNASDKSKRYSTSSSGSVYSDKHGLPFALSKRVSAVSDQTDSSEEDFAVRLREKGKAFGRTPWSNEYLLPLKLDELVQASIDSQEILERPNTVSSLREQKSRRGAGITRLPEAVKSSSSLPKPFGKSQSDAGSSAESVDSVPLEANEATASDAERDSKEDKSTAEPVAQPQVELSTPSGEGQQVEGEVPAVLAEGVPVLARWTDKRYYSGVLFGAPKNELWEVKFDDGTKKAVREDLIMPREWLKAGALVFTLVDDKYVSGQIVDVQKGKEVIYAVELDVKKKRVVAKASDLRLTDVMASIIREKYKPLAATPRGKADIDFDNVLSGKRLREQKTPSRPTSAPHPADSQTKKRCFSRKKSKDESNKESPKQNPSALRSEGGHLVEDKAASADSPSENDRGQTPLRSSGNDTRPTARPRTLSYGPEGSRPSRGRAKDWLAADGTPIPGPSGVKLRGKKPRPKEEEAEGPPKKKVGEDGAGSLRGASGGSGSVERGKRKRGAEGVGEERGGRKWVKKGDARTKSKSKK